MKRKIILVLILVCAIPLLPLYSQEATFGSTPAYGRDKWMSGLKTLSAYVISGFQDAGVGVDINGILIALNASFFPLGASLDLGFATEVKIIEDVFFFETAIMYSIPFYESEDNPYPEDADKYLISRLKTSIGIKAKISWFYLAVGADAAAIIMNSVSDGSQQRKIPIMIRVGYNIQ